MLHPVPTSTDPPSVSTPTTAARWLRLAVGAGEILAVGVLVPVAVLAIGTPVVLVVRLLIEMAERL